MEYLSALPIGSILRGNYHIECVLGHGGFGVTYLAVHNLLNKKVAIKEFFPHSLCLRNEQTGFVSAVTMANVALVDKLRIKFIKEAERMAGFDSPYIVNVTDVFEENGTAYYVMDYIEGGSLHDAVVQYGPMSLPKALRYISKVGIALDYIHSEHINHLDVKPANIMVRTKDDVPMLIDFGLSKHYDTDGKQTTTTPVGISHGFAPIEQYNEGGVADFSAETDVYALAATLYFLLSGKTPPRATLLVEEKLTFPSVIPQSLHEPISRAMAPRRKNRYSSVSEFIAEIGNALRGPVSEYTLNQQLSVSVETEIKKEPQSELKQPVKTKSDNELDKEKPIRLKGCLISLLIVLPFIILAFIGFRHIQWFAMSDSIGTESIERYSVPDGYADGYGYVDLGLPSGTKWATMNIGAGNPEDFGLFFAWGDTFAKDAYDESSCLTWCKSNEELSRLGYLDEYGVLSMAYDPATVQWGELWTMPTKAQIMELQSECEWTWYKDGYTVKGPNGKSIFLPPAGRTGLEEYNYNELGGNYWASEPLDDGFDAYYLYFDTQEISVGARKRYTGRSIRPVLKINNEN